MLYGILAHGFHFHCDTLRTGHSTTECRGGGDDWGDYRFDRFQDILLWDMWDAFGVIQANATAMECSKLAHQQRANNLVDPINDTRTATIEI